MTIKKSQKGWKAHQTHIKTVTNDQGNQIRYCKEIGYLPIDWLTRQNTISLMETPRF